MIKTVLAFVAATFATSLHAQSFEEVMQAAQSNVGEMSRYQEALQNPDQRFQYALIQQMLALEDPALQRIAKEHALFSTNPVMREAAIKAILDSGSTLRMQIAATSETYQNVSNFISSQGGTFVNNQGEILWRVPKALGAECWGLKDKCMFRQVSNSIQFNPGSYINATLTLGNDGVMRGNLSYSNKEFAQIQIDLKE